MLYLQIASPKSSVLNFLDSNSFEVIISIFQRTEKVPDMERLPYYCQRNDEERLLHPFLHLQLQLHLRCRQEGNYLSVGTDCECFISAIT